MDAAVAVGFALAVTHPSAGNIGGGGFLLARFADGRTTFIDFRETALRRHLTTCIWTPRETPLATAWWDGALPEYPAVSAVRTCSQEVRPEAEGELIRPAVDLAQKGFAVSYRLMESLENSRTLGDFPNRGHLSEDGNFYEMDEVLQQPELGRTLDRIARSAQMSSIRARQRETLAAEMAKNGGLVTVNDLQQYKAVERRPLEGDYKGYHLITAPPPSSGGIGILQMLGMLENSGYEKAGYGTRRRSIHYVAEAMRRYYADRSEYLGDADFYTVPVAGITHPDYIRRRAAPSTAITRHPRRPARSW